MKKIREKDLVPFVEEYFTKQGYMVFKEQYIGFGRADLVAITLNNDEAKRRMEHHVPQIPIRTFLRMLRIIERNGSIAINDLARSMGYSKSYVRRIISYVNPLYLINRNGVVSLLNGYVPYTNEVIAIEVKKKDWRNGLVQADHYLIAAHKSYLAIPEKTYHKIPPEVIDWAQNNGIGIITIGTKGRIEEKIPAKKMGPRIKASYYRLIESLWPKVSRILNHLSI